MNKLKLRISLGTFLLVFTCSVMASEEQHNLKTVIHQGQSFSDDQAKLVSYVGFGLDVKKDKSEKIYVYVTTRHEKFSMQIIDRNLALGKSIIINGKLYGLNSYNSDEEWKKQFKKYEEKNVLPTGMPDKLANDTMTIEYQRDLDVDSESIIMENKNDVEYNLAVNGSEQTPLKISPISANEINLTWFLVSRTESGVKLIPHGEKIKVGESFVISSKDKIEIEYVKSIAKTDSHEDLYVLSIKLESER